MAVLERISFSPDAFWRAAPKLYVLHRGDIVSTSILTDARNALLLLAVTHVCYNLSHDKNKENNAYSRPLFLNLQPNGIPRIIAHVQNATFILTRQSNVYTHHNLSDFLPKECQWVQKLVWKAVKWSSLTFGGKISRLGAEFEGPPGLLHKPDVISRFPCSSRAFWVLMGPKQTPNDQVMTVLVNAGTLYGSPWNNFIFSWCVLARRPKILSPP